MHSRAVHSSLALCGNNGPLHSLWAQDCQQEPEFSLHIERQIRKGGEEKEGCRGGRGTDRILREKRRERDHTEGGGKEEKRGTWRSHVLSGVGEVRGSVKG